MTLAEIMVRQKEMLMAVAVVMFLGMLIVVGIMAMMGLQEIHGKYPSNKAIVKAEDIKPSQITGLNFDEVYNFLDSNFNEIIAFGDDLLKYKVPVVGGQDVKNGLVYESFRRATSAIESRLATLSIRLLDTDFVSANSGVGAQSRQRLVKDFSEKYRSLYKV